MLTKMTNSDKIFRKEGIVVFLDALGVKHLGTQKSIDFIEKRKKFLEECIYIQDRRSEQFKRDLNIDLPKPDIALFQDSIIISWEEEKPKREPEQEKYYFSFFQAVGQWLIDAITEAIREDLFFRGAISQGEYIVNMSNQNVTIIGPAVDDASDFFEIADWVGVIQTPDCEKKYTSYLTTIAEKESKRTGVAKNLEDVIYDYRFLFVRYPVPLSIKNLDFFSLKQDSLSLTKKHFTSAWPVMACKIESKISILNILLSHLILEKPEHQSKYYHSYLFLEWFRANFWEGLRQRPDE
jgi:hypothetical protein